MLCGFLDISDTPSADLGDYTKRDCQRRIQALCRRGLLDMAWWQHAMPGETLQALLSRATGRTLFHSLHDADDDDGRGLESLGRRMGVELLRRVD